MTAPPFQATIHDARDPYRTRAWRATGAVASRRRPAHGGAPRAPGATQSPRLSFSRAVTTMYDPACRVAAKPLAP